MKYCVWEGEELLRPVPHTDLCCAQFAAGKQVKSRDTAETGTYGLQSPGNLGIINVRADLDNMQV